MMCNKKIIPTSLLILIIVSILSFSSVSAQVPHSELLWSEPVELSAGMEGSHIFPNVIADPFGGVHVFWNQRIETLELSYSLVAYAFWDGVIWSTPVDVIASETRFRAADDADAVVDQQGIMHTVWLSEVGINYAQRDISTPISSLSWKDKRTLVNYDFEHVGPLAIDIDHHGILHLVYLYQGSGLHGIYYLNSMDGGATWSLPYVVSGPSWSSDQQQYRAHFNTFDFIITKNKIHLVWQQRLEEETQLRYSQSIDGGTTWTNSRTIARGFWPRFVLFDDQEMSIVYTGRWMETGEICMKQQVSSSDGGKSWSLPELILQPGVKGCLGTNIAYDSKGRAYLITSAYQEIDLEGEKIYISTWEGDRWQIPELVQWQTTSYPSLGDQPDFPTVAVLQGNELHVVFFVKEGRIFHTSAKLDAPQTPQFLQPTPEEVIVVPTITPVEKITNEFSLGSIPLEPLPNEQTQLPVVAGTGVSLLVIFSILFVFYIRRK